MSTIRPSRRIMTKMMQNIYRPETATLMAQHMFRPSDDAYDPSDNVHTYMVQNMYNQKW